CSNGLTGTIGRKTCNRCRSSACRVTPTRSRASYRRSIGMSDAMNLMELLHTNGDRHLTTAEREQLRSCASGLETAVRVSAAIEESEAAAIEDVVTALRERYPRFGQLQPQAWERL